MEAHTHATRAQKEISADIGIFLTGNDIAEILGITKRAAAKMAAANRWPAIKSRGNGGIINTYPLQSLPVDIQTGWMETREHIYKDTSDSSGDIYNNDTSIQEGESAAETLPAIRPPSSPLYNKEGQTVSLREIIPSLAVQTDPWNALPEAARNKGYELLNIVNQARNILAGASKRQKTKALADYSKSVDCHAYTLRRLIKRADEALEKAQQRGDDTITAQITALAPKYGKTRDLVKAYDENAIIYALSVYAAPEMRTMRDVYKETLAQAAARNWQTGTYQTLCNYLKRLDRATTTLARQGKKRFEADCLLKILRNYDEIPPNFMWCGDHHIFDVFVKLPDGRGGWNYKRPWLTAWLDMRSRSFMGWCISFKPNSRTIGMALTHAISSKNDPAFMQCGLPRSVYIDNGKDYRAKYLNGEEIKIGAIDYPAIMERFSALGIDPFYIDLEFDPEQNTWVKRRGVRTIEIKGVRVGGVYARLGIGQRYATAYHPWAKPIERAFRTVVQSFSRSLPGWCGSGHEQRPEKLAFELKSGQQILTIEEFCDRFYGWVVNNYHTSPHSGHGMEGRSPNEVFTSLLPAPQTCEPALLDFALLKKENVKIHNWGFNLDGRQFELDVPVNLQGARILDVLIGQWATVFFDYEYKQVRVYKDGLWQCNARKLNRASFTDSDDPVMIDKLKLQAYQKKLSAGTIQVINSHPATAQDPNEAAALLAISQETRREVEHDLISAGNEDCVPGTEAGTVQIYSSSDVAIPLEAGIQGTPPPCPYDDLICLTLMDRYQKQILPKLAGGWDLTPEQQNAKNKFEATEMYQASQQLYETEFEYLKHLAGRQA